MWRPPHAWRARPWSRLCKSTAEPLCHTFLGPTRGRARPCRRAAAARYAAAEEGCCGSRGVCCEATDPSLRWRWGEWASEGCRERGVSERGERLSSSMSRQSPSSPADTESESARAMEPPRDEKEPSGDPDARAAAAARGEPWSLRAAPARSVRCAVRGGGGGGRWGAERCNGCREDHSQGEKSLVHQGFRSAKRRGPGVHTRC